MVPIIDLILYEFDVSRSKAFHKVDKRLSDNPKPHISHIEKYLRRKNLMVWLYTGWLLPSTQRPGWRNWIARKTSNLEVLGSSPRSGVSKSYFGQMCTYCHLTFFQVIWSHTHVLVSLFLSFSLLHFYLVFQLLCLVRCLSSPCNSPCHESSRELYRQSGSCIPEL